MNEKKIILILAIVWMLVIPLISVQRGHSTFKSDGDHSNTSIDTEAVIQINNNSALAAYASQGNGSASNPYIIEDKIIGGNQPSGGIFIQDTTAFFTLRNCNISDIGQYGIRLVQVTHGKITNCMISNITSKGVGIILDTCNDISVSNNTVADTSYWGIMLYYSDNNSLVDNKFENNTHYYGSDWYDRGYGILLRASNNNIISNNTANNNYYGIGCYASIHNTIFNNTANNNRFSGIYLLYQGDNEICNNTANNNFYNGILLDSADYNTVAFNIANDNGFVGIRVENSASFNEVRWNKLYNNTFGWKVDSGCDGNIFENNDCINAPLPGSNSPSDGSYEKGSSGKVISWIITDNRLGYGGFEIWRNGSLYRTETYTWWSGQSLNIPINTTGEGVWNYTLTYRNAFGVDAGIDTVYILITPSTIPSYDLCLSLIMLVVIALFVRRRKSV